MKCPVCNSYNPITMHRNINNEVDVYERYCSNCNKCRTFYEDRVLPYSRAAHTILVSEHRERIRKMFDLLFQIISSVNEDINYLIDNTGCPCCVCILENFKYLIAPSNVNKNEKIVFMLKKLHKKDSFIPCIGLCKPRIDL